MIIDIAVGISAIAFTVFHIVTEIMDRKREKNEVSCADGGKDNE